MSKIKYPIGIQTFPEIIRNGYIYVDKTEFVYELISSGKYYFLNRPRRFGKSLLISTIETLFKGERDLFRGLAIDNLEWEWHRHEVLHLDLNVRNYNGDDSLDTILDRHLKKWEMMYGIVKDTDIPEDRFIAIIERAYELSGRGVVILIDEYDKPLLSTIGRPELQDKYRHQLQALFGVLKSLDRYIKFGMVTGVSRFSKVSIFSSLNNLRDISLTNKFNAICGITENELEQYFCVSASEMAKELGMTTKELHKELKSNYDGYHFSGKGKDIYNPFNILNTFSNREFGSYWLATGTTSSLLDVLNINTFPIKELDGFKCSENLLNGSDIFLSDPIPFFFQTGYLSIKDYNEEFKEYTLGFPNREVAEGFNDLVMKAYMRVSEPSMMINDFVRDVREGKVDEFMNKLQSFFAGIPYDYFGNAKGNKGDLNISGTLEVHYQNVMYVIMKLMGFHTHTEIRTSNGRIDMTVETKDFIYIMEFKIDSSAQLAVDQINSKNYTLPYRHSGKKVFKIGANFDTRTRILSEWVIEVV